MEPVQVLIVGGSQDAVQHVQGLLSSWSITSEAVGLGSEALKRLSDGKFCAAAIHLDGRPREARELVAAARRHAPHTFVIVIAEAPDMPTPAECVAAGAFDSLVKPLRGSDFLVVLQRALTKSKLCSGANLASVQGAKRNREWPFSEIIGDSEAMQVVYDWVSKVAQSDANVCVYGESGTGKELIARAIHNSGRRHGRPFVILDCAAIPEGLMESEMFGHVRGAFTSAVEARVGVFQLADTGTLFLDEVAELTLPLQAKLLRVIQNREFRRVGSSNSIRVDVRIIAATNRNLAEMVKRGEFREDLFYRLDVISFTVPPLRERKEDIPLLVDHFVQSFNRQSRKHIRGISGATLRLLLKYDWPGNVRELQNCIERSGVMAESDFIEISDLSQVLHPVSQAGPQKEAGYSLQEMEKSLILKTLRQTRGNKTAAAALLGISLRGLHYKLKKLDHHGTQRVTA